MKDNLKQRIEEEIGEKIEGGFLPNGVCITSSGRKLFIKSGTVSETYKCEADGLLEIDKSKTIGTVKVVAYGRDHIITEYVSQGNKGADFFKNFGRKLALMHKCKSENFGFYEDNFIGANPQKNIAEGNEKTDWAAFYFNKRLLFQYRIAESKGYISGHLKDTFKRLEKNIYGILEESYEEPCLIHGDLWGGNYLPSPDGEPVLLDPAVYYGHREAELAMTKLFGGFSPEFYKSYQDEYPLKEGWYYRENIYKLYHIMNHLNIFGRTYLQETEFIVNHYASESYGKDR